MRFLVRKLDDFLRKSNKVFEFSQEAGCLLRLQATRAPHTIYLPDLTLKAGEPVLMIHLWNERLPPFSPGGSDLAWARRLLHDFTRSLRLAAGYLCETPALSGVRAVGGASILLTSGLHQGGSRFVQELGFTVVPYAGPLGRFGEFWENFYSWLILWTYNPASLPGYAFFSLRRSEMWMSREAFLQRFDKPR